MRKIVKNKQHAGFSILELLVVVTMSVIVATIAVPAYLSVAANLRVSGDLRSINGLTALAKMRAASDFTHARVYADLTANTYHMEFWNKAGNGGAGCWQTDGDTANACTAVGSPVAQLSQGVTYGNGGVGTGPTVGTPTTVQAPLCIKKVAGNPGGTGGTNANTACIEFNSRGIPVDTTNAPVSTGALYLKNQNTAAAVTVSATGSIQSWTVPVGQTTWNAQ